MITREDIECSRTPAELREFVAVMRSRVETDQEELKIGLRKVGFYKMFIDEIMPLALAAEHVCASTDRLLPVYGNQGYDAVVLGLSGKEVGRIEIAKPYDGKAGAEDVKLMEQRRYGKFRTQGFGKGLPKASAQIISTAKTKSAKDYRDCTLLIVGTIYPPFDCELSIVINAAELLSNELRQLRYIAKKVFFVVPSLQKSYLIQE